MLREHLVGRSAASFHSFVTSVAFHNIGKHVARIVNPVWSMTTAICEHLSLGDLPREVREMASNPWTARICKAFDLSHSEAEELFEEAAFGGSVVNWL